MAGKSWFNLSSRPKEPILFFSKTEKAQIIQAIQEAEMKTSAEIRVHLEKKVKGDILEYAKKVFVRLKMDQTKDRNGVLIFMGVHSKRFAILGDSGIHEKVSQDFWSKIAQEMSQAFKQDLFADGIVSAIQYAGEALAKHYPYTRHDINELPDEISYS